MEINGRTTVGMRENLMILIERFHYIRCKLPHIVDYDRTTSIGFTTS